jgi:uncharacterized membrane protein YqhA
MFKWIEAVLWNSRLAVLVAVIASVLVAMGVFYLATVDMVEVIEHLSHYSKEHGDAREKLREKVVSSIIQVIDGYLLAATMIIFALGLYELFIGKIELATESEHAENILLIRSLDDLKDRLAKMILLMLAIKFFEQSGRMNFQTPLDLLYLAVGVVLIAGSIVLTHIGHGKDAHGEDAHGKDAHAADGALPEKKEAAIT